MQDDRSFLGTGWGFPPTFEKESLTGVTMVSDNQDIRESIRILLGTSLGERTMLPQYGCNLTDYLFESITNSKLNLIRERVRSSLIKYEPRIEVTQVDVDGSDYLDGTIYVKIDYFVRKTNTRFNLVYPYYIAEGTDIPVLYQKQVAQIKEAVTPES